MFLRHSKNEFFYPVLAILTILILFWHHHGMEKTLQIYPGTNAPIVRNDSVNGGQSIGELSDAGGLLKLKCQIRQTPHIFPFCGVFFPVVDGVKGIDLNAYTEFKLWLSIDTDSRDTVLVYLDSEEQNFEGKSLTRAHVRTISPSGDMALYELPLDSFFVPSWWLFANPSDDRKGAPDLSSIARVQVTTGDNRYERSETINISRIEIAGKWVSAQTLYTAIAAVWIFVIILHSFRALMVLRGRLLNAKLRSVELEKINNLLSIEKSKFESMAKVDPLTGALNRAGIRDVLDSVQKRFVRNRTPCSVLMFDIDNFKQVNDQHGHDVGDEILVGIASLLTSLCRAGDSLARWGGEEFIVILPNTELDVAILVAQKYRKVLADSILGKVKVTCSFGVSQLGASGISACFKEADVALYRAKAHGRNRVEPSR